MGIFWSLIKGLNEVLINSLTCESNEHESVDENSVESLQIDEWYKQLHYSTDNEIDRYLEKYSKVICEYTGEESLSYLNKMLKEESKIIKKYCQE